MRLIIGFKKNGKWLSFFSNQKLLFWLYICAKYSEERAVI